MLKAKERLPRLDSLTPDERALEKEIIQTLDEALTSMGPDGERRIDLAMEADTHHVLYGRRSPEK